MRTTHYHIITNEDWLCDCGNQSHIDGFFPCDSNGTEVEPTVDSDWDGLYVCARCERLHQLLG